MMNPPGLRSKVGKWRGDDRPRFIEIHWWNFSKATSNSAQFNLHVIVLHSNAEGACESNMEVECADEGGRVRMKKREKFQGSRKSMHPFDQKMQFCCSLKLRVYGKLNSWK